MNWNWRLASHVALEPAKLLLFSRSFLSFTDEGAHSQTDSEAALSKFGLLLIRIGGGLLPASSLIELFTKGLSPRVVFWNTDIDKNSALF